MKTPGKKIELIPGTYALYGSFAVWYYWGLERYMPLFCMVSFKNIPDLIHEGIPQEVFLVLPFDKKIPRGTDEFHKGFLANSSPEYSVGRGVAAPLIPSVKYQKEPVMRRIILFLIAVYSTAVLSAPLPYDESADAKVAVKNALVAAKTNHKPVLIVFGANWCIDCHALDHALKNDKTAALLAGSFNLVKVDVGKFDHNLDVVAAYGNPIKKGIPAAVVVSVDNKVLYATKAGELADARRMSETGIYEFFRRISQSAAAGK